VRFTNIALVWFYSPTSHVKQEVGSKLPSCESIADMPIQRSSNQFKSTMYRVLLSRHVPVRSLPLSRQTCGALFQDQLSIKLWLIHNGSKREHLTLASAQFFKSSITGTCIISCSPAVLALHIRLNLISISSLLLSRTLYLRELGEFRLTEFS